ncbi:hypothetical protein TFKS16_1237 [Tannerella forsythia KS16]|uniref:Uncharacterized protein n=1 Tax=Tannerella forsythia (strain ATCC 43037 / JCM 10827 / CCUG 21028 A / KCTC 5666 / FDC 338) TaxID=203275 RepID=G8UPI0_TANFA|nr:hypothetical protein BFO_0916 [Tannerella forsythia 92A2]BAR48416.1 hypothetical protein TF3313_0856 [Tannerella forsythia 3313]BAR51504.1 hypothetical protein TFKS16_1237 [Tannerella forsythia KS16]
MIKTFFLIVLLFNSLQWQGDPFGRSEDRPVMEKTEQRIFCYNFFTASFSAVR